MLDCPVCGVPQPWGQIVDHLNLAHTPAEIEAALAVHTEYARTLIEEVQARMNDA